MLPRRALARSGASLGLSQKISQPSTRPSSALYTIKSTGVRQLSTGGRSNGAIFSQIQTRVAGGPAMRRGGAALVMMTQARFASSASTSQTSSPAAEAAGAAQTTATDPVSTLSTTPLDLDGAALLNMPEQIGYLQALGLDFGWGPTAMLEWLLEHIHIYTGLPWWASIATTTLLLRAIIFKPSLSSAEQSAKMARLAREPTFARLNEEMKAAAMSSDPNAAANAMAVRQKVTMMRRAEGIKMWKMAIPFINIPLAFGFFRLLRSMAAVPVPGLETGGLLWFQDLTVSDPLLILPMISSAGMFLIMRQNLKYMQPSQAKFMSAMTWVLSPLSFWFTYKMSAGVQFFFLVSATGQWLQMALFQSAPVRRWAGLPPLEVFDHASDSKTSNSPNKPIWQSPRASSFSTTDANKSGRTISTTATDLTPEQPTESEPTPTSASSRNPFTSLRQSMRGVSEKVNEYADKKSVSNEREKALKFEERRAMEDKNRFYERMQERRMNAAQKGRDRRQ